MWFSFRLSRHSRLGIPWWLAIPLFPFVAFAWAVYALFYLVGLVIVGIVWLCARPFRRKPKHRPSTPHGDGQIRITLTYHED